MRLEQADNLLTFAERAARAGYTIVIEPCGVSVTHPNADPCAIVGRDLRDALAHALNPIVLDLDLEEQEMLDLLNRLVSDTEPLLSADRDRREVDDDHDSALCDCSGCDNRRHAERSHQGI
jgi:hypothetical protein